MGWEGAGQGEINDWHFVLAAGRSQFSQSVGPSGRLVPAPASVQIQFQIQFQHRCQSVSVPVPVPVLDNPDALPLLVYSFPWWIPTGREGGDPPIENVTSARPSKSPGGPPSLGLSSIDRPAASGLSCCRVVGGAAGGTHHPRKDPRKPKIPGSRTQQLDPSPSDRRTCSSVQCFPPPRLPAQTPARLDTASETAARGLRGRCGSLSSLLLVSESWAEWIAVTARKMGRSLHYE